MADFYKICYFTIVWIILFCIGCDFIVHGCNKDFQTSCMNFYIRSGKSQSVVITEEIYNKKTRFYLNAIMNYGYNKTCSVSMKKSYPSYEEAVSAQQKIPLNVTNTIYISKQKVIKCYLSDVSEKNFIIGFTILIICGVPCACCLLLSMMISADYAFRNVRIEGGKKQQINLVIAYPSMTAIPVTIACSEKEQTETIV